MQKESASRFSINWFFWSGLFASGTLFSIWWEWQSDVSHSIGWFIAISLWSAVCAIGYSLIDWISKK